MKKVNSFVRGNLTKIYLGFMLLFWILIMASCEKEPIEPFQLPTAVDPTEISGQWDITKFYMLEEGFRLDVSAWVEYVNDSTFDEDKQGAEPLLVSVLLLVSVSTDFNRILGYLDCKFEDRAWGPSKRDTKTMNPNHPKNRKKTGFIVPGPVIAVQKPTPAN